MCTDSSSTSTDALSRRSSRERSDRTVPSLGQLQGERIAVTCAGVEEAGRAIEATQIGEPQDDVAARDEPLELLRGAFDDQPAVVEQRDPVGEVVGLLQVLRGEEDGDAAGHEVTDDLPHAAAAARIEAGGRLVEEDDARPADQRHRQVEPAPHAAGVRHGQLPGGVDQVELIEQLRDPPAARRAVEVAQVGHQGQVFLAGEQPVHRGELAGDADRVPDRVRLPRHVVAGDADLAAVGADQRRHDVYGGRLAGAVGTEQCEGRSLGNGQVDAVEDELVAVRLA